MSKRRTHVDWLRDIVDWSARLDSHLATTDYEGFKRSRLVQDAVMRCIEVVGEASGHLLRDRSVRDSLLSTMDLQGAYAARNKLSHGYWGLDPLLVWSAATQSVPALAAEAQRILDQIDRTP